MEETSPHYIRENTVFRKKFHTLKDFIVCHSWGYRSENYAIMQTLKIHYFPISNRHRRMTVAWRYTIFCCQSGVDFVKKPRSREESKGEWFETWYCL